MKTPLLAILVASITFAPAAYAGAQFKGPLDICVQSALVKYPGTVTSLRAEIENGKTQYELDITGKDGKFWEAECDAKTGKITETEQEVSADDPAFTSKAKVSLDAATKTALSKYPGTVIKTEYEIESDGVAYEFDIKTSGGKVLEVEVHAVSGKLGEPEEVVYQIGD